MGIQTVKKFPFYRVIYLHEGGRISTSQKLHFGSGENPTGMEHLMVLNRIWFRVKFNPSTVSIWNIRIPQGNGTLGGFNPEWLMGSN